MERSFLEGLSHAFSFVASVGFLGLAYYAGIMAQRIKNLEHWKDDRDGLLGEQTEAINLIRIDLAEIKKEMRMHTERLERLSGRIGGSLR